MARRLAGAPRLLEAALHVRGIRHRRAEARRAQDRDHAAAPPPDASELPDGLDDADVVVADGGGYLTDADVDQTERTLRLLGEAQRRGKPTIMFSQGIGPLEDPALRALAADVFPAVDLIGLREGLKGPELLAGLGVDESRVVVTGDDAIELAHAARNPELGSDLGVCFRLVDYMGFEAHHAHMVSDVIGAAAQRHRARLVPVHISEYSDEDRIASRTVTAGHRAVADRRCEAPPVHAVRRVGRCRVLVTAAYHAGVFALSQGIPIVALSRSAYYDWKFNGLTDMFGGGCEIVDLSAGDVAERLDAAIDRAWANAPHDRMALLTAAARQMAGARGAYLRARQVIEAKVVAAR